MGAERVPGDSAGTRFQLCGRLAIRLLGERIEDRIPGRQGRLLLAYLAVQPYRSATRDELTEAIWPGKLPSAPELGLSALISKLRRLLGADALQGRDEVRLVLPPASWVDVECAHQQIHRAESLVAGGRWREAYGPTVTARYIAERTFLRGESGPWIEAQRGALEDVHLRALECDVRIGLAVGGHEGPIAARSACRLVELAPYRESGYCLWMQALEQDGNVAEAVRVYERLRELLRDELGTIPSPAAQELHRRLLATT